jgi:hypothetical protein
MNFLNTNLLPLDVLESPWLKEKKDNIVFNADIGKWMLFYDKKFINEAWILATKLYRENTLDGVISMKCSTAYVNPRASSVNSGVIILYCQSSSNENQIMQIGKEILELMNFRESNYIYYKTDFQTHEGTRATGCKKNYTYRLANHLFGGKCLLTI